MRLLIISLLFTLLFVSCSTEKNIISKKINVTLIDQNTDAYVQGGEISFTTIVGNIDVYQDVKYTDGNGNCSFLFDYKNENQYRIHAYKEGLLTYLVNDSLDFSKSNMEINADTEEDIKLYLTSDTMNNINYWKEVTSHYEMEELINILKSNTYSNGIPWLVWEDIPALLAAGNDSTVITHFPHNPISSYLLDECYVGVIALWLVESIRIAERDNLISPFAKYPSLNPILYLSNHPEPIPSNTIEKMTEAYAAYQAWWAEVQNMDKSDACKTNPLEETMLSW